MEKERYKCPVAVILILIRYNKSTGCKEVLLQKRYNTGYMDRVYDLSSSGHLEKGEFLEDAIIRETAEEIKININKKDLKFSNVVHDISSDKAYINFNFVCENFEGEPQIGEPHKCSEIIWSDINNLPKNMMCERKHAINNYIQNTQFEENVVVQNKN